MIRVGIAGSTGYVGCELMRLLYAHPSAQIVSVSSRDCGGRRYDEFFGHYRHRRDVVCVDESIESMAEHCDVVFLAMPHGVASGQVTEAALKNAFIIDLGADFRLSDADVYESWYETPHMAKGLLQSAVYGLCELNRERVRGARLIANPGCYTTCAILSLYPLVKEGVIDSEGIVVDAMSGVSGAGRSVDLSVHFAELNESAKAYKIASHRHTPEIEEQLSLAAGKAVKLTFTPHLVPMNRCILSTSYAMLKKGYGHNDIAEIYNRYYGDEYFVRLTDQDVFPETRWVKGSNFCDIGFKVDERTGRVIVIGALDNLVKGAAGQAVQNMNILFGLEESAGLDALPPFPV